MARHHRCLPAGGSGGVAGLDPLAPAGGFRGLCGALYPSGERSLVRRGSAQPPGGRRAGRGWDGEPGWLAKGRRSGKRRGGRALSLSGGGDLKRDQASDMRVGWGQGSEQASD